MDTLEFSPQTNSCGGKGVKSVFFPPPPPQIRARICLNQHFKTGQFLNLDGLNSNPTHTFKKLLAFPIRSPWYICIQCADKARLSLYESNTVGSVKEWLSVLTGVHVEQANLRESLGDIRRDRIKLFVITGCSIPNRITLTRSLLEILPKNAF